ncbi:unnamed protein product [Withania somnifera]
METTQWSTQEIGVMKSTSMGEEIGSKGGELINKKVRPVKDGAINCPRCNSTNTKFCYYNNYSLTQPRYFCKTCRRYWTEGGTLRNVPVGGGSRKNKRPSSSQKLPDLNPNLSISHVPDHHHQNPNKIGNNQDLGLGFRTVSHDHQMFHGHVLPQFLELPKMDGSNNHLGSTQISALELLRTGIAARGFTSFISSPSSTPDLNALYTSGFPFQDVKPSVGGTTDHQAASTLSNFSNGGPGPGVQENGGARIMFSLGGLKQLSSGTNEADHNHHQTKGQEINNSTDGLYWNGMLGAGGGSAW